MKVVRNTLMEEIVTSPRYKREPLHSLAIVENFSRFHQQDEHNASFFSIKFVNLGTKHVLGLTMQKYKKYYVAQDFFDSHRRPQGCGRP